MARTKSAEVSNSSKFMMYGTEVGIGDDQWVFAKDRAGGGDQFVRWDFEVVDGKKFTDARYRPLLEEFAHFLISRVDDTRGRSPPSPSTIATSSYALRTLARWMVSKNLKSVTSITSEMSWDYADYALTAATEMARSGRGLSRVTDPGEAHDDEPASASFNTAYVMLNVLTHMHLQADALRSRGVAFVPAPPYDGRSILKVLTEDQGLSKDGRLVPIPDDVAIPTLNQAIRLIGEPAKDVMALMSIHENVRDLPPGPKRNAAYKENREAIRSFEFSTIAGEFDPWHEPIDNYDRTYRDTRKFEIKEVQAVRRLVISIQTACAIIVQGLTGMRAHELIGVRVEPNLTNGLPSCIEVETLRDGTMRKFFLKSKVSKGSKREARWLLGTSFIGAENLPITVRALQVLFEFNKPLRDLGKTDALFLSFSNGQGLPRNARSVGEIRTQVMSDRQKDFVNEMVDLSNASEESKRLYGNGGVLRPHQWRTTFAMFVVRVNPKLLPALSEHYKHMNSAITEEGYIGKDPSFRYSMESALAQISSEDLLALTSPESVLLGGGAKKFRQDAQKIREMIEEQPGMTLQEKSLSFVEENELYIYDAAHGSCLSGFAPSKSRCRQMAGYAGPLRPYPNDIFRSVSTCSMCENLIVSEAHRAHYESRAEINQKVLDDEKTDQDSGWAFNARQRVRQSRQYLKMMDRVKVEE